MRRRLIAATVAGVALIALWVATALASESAPTTVTLEQSPGYLYIGDEVTLTATVTPNPGGGTVTFSYGGVIPEIAVVPVDPGTGTATLTFAPTFHFGAVDVYAAFGGTASFGWSQTNLYVDVRWLPIAGIIETPAPATNDTDASIAFLASPEISTQCRLDGESFADCTSPVHLHDLTEGEHTFDVRATVIADGHVGRIATTTWFTDLTGPVPGDVQLDGGATTTNRQQVLTDRACDRRTERDPVIPGLVDRPDGQRRPTGRRPGSPLDRWVNRDVVSGSDRRQRSANRVRPVDGFRRQRVGGRVADHRRSDRRSSTRRGRMANGHRID